MTLEQFKYIDGYGEKYVVSSWGKVYRKVPGLNKITEIYEINAEITKKGYLRVNLFDENMVRKHFKVHRLVAQAFIPNPDNKPQVNHIDGNKQNNSITNLEWVTDEENKLHRNLILDKNLRQGETV